MSKRTIISIDEEKCNGCGLCIPNCPEGAMQVIDGKARLISDLFCDGLGACVGYCPEGAITLTEREAEPYDEAKTMVNIARQGAGTIKAHLEHLSSHGEKGYLAQALTWMAQEGIPVPAGFSAEAAPARPAAAPAAVAVAEPPAPAGSALANWPIQLHLLSPMAPRFQGADVLLSADCVAHAVGNFHSSMLAGKALAIACPKLDDGQEVYREKITALIDHAQIASLTVAMMQVPCCRSLLGVAQKARDHARRKIPLKAVIVAIDDGSILMEQGV
ncbi:MAG TPA: 4Fe-4S binding protein [bacterium]|nr:4Fe-4S binding protein [bacterium]